MPGNHDAQLANIERTLGRIEGTLSEMAIARAVENLTVSEHGRRISALERWRTWIAGIAVAVMTAVTGAHVIKP